MNLLTKNLLLSITVFLFSGCTTTPANDKALGDSSYAITLEDALASVGTGLSKMVENKGETNFGLAVTEVEVKFNLTIKANDTNKFEGKADANGGTKSVTEKSAEQNSSNSNTGKSSGSGKESTTGETGSKETTTAQENSTASSSDSKNKTSTTNETGLTGKASLVLEKSGSIDSDRSNNVAIRFVGIPVLVEKLSIEKLNFLKELGYFSTPFKPFDKNGKPLGLLSGSIDPETKKKIEEALKGALIKKD